MRQCRGRHLPTQKQVHGTIKRYGSSPSMDICVDEQRQLADADVSGRPALSHFGEGQYLQLSILEQLIS